MRLELTDIRVGDDGQFAERYRRQIDAFKQMHAGRTVDVTMGPPRRTSAQNRYYWLCLEAIRRALVDAGYTQFSDREAGKATLHRHFAEKHLGCETWTLPDGTMQTRPVSTRFQDRAAFSDYIENIHLDEMVLALGVELPRPDEYEERTGTRFRSYQLTAP